MIKNGDLAVKLNGCIVLPEKYKDLSDSGECFIVKFGDKTAIYFYIFRGIIDSSKGYLYVADDLLYTDYINTNKFSAEQDFINIVELEKNLYSCSTG